MLQHPYPHRTVSPLHSPATPRYATAPVSAPNGLSPPLASHSPWSRLRRLRSLPPSSPSHQDPPMLMLESGASMMDAIEPPTRAQALFTAGPRLHAPGTS